MVTFLLPHGRSRQVRTPRLWRWQRWDMPRWHRRPPPLLLCLLSAAAPSPQQGLGTGPGRAGPGPGRKAIGTMDNRECLGRPIPPHLPAPPTPGTHRASLLSSAHPLPGTVSPKNFKVKMVMKTSVLLSWEFPDNYNSPTPYKVWPRGWRGRGAGARSGIKVVWCWGAAALG